MMIRPFTLFCAVFAGISGMVLYTQKHKTTLLDRQIAKIVYDTQKIKSQTAMLRTEWTLLNQPDRLKILANQFTPQLRPLQPSQFVQMASITQYLPAPKIENKPDKTRDEIGKTVAESHGQDYTGNNPEKTTQEPSSKSTSQEEINEEINQATPIMIRPTTTVQNAPPHNLKTTSNKSAVKPTIKPVIQTKPETENVEAQQEAKPETKSLTKPEVKVASNKSKHNDMVAYNIQGGNTFTRSKTEVSKPAKMTNTSNKSTTPKSTTIANAINDDTVPSNIDSTINSSIKKATLKKQTRTQVVKNSKENSNPIKMVRYEPKKTIHHSESALENNPNDALPPPVPFSR